jgi:predicted DNA-binding transcriptional regulator AlpA
MAKRTTKPANRTADDRVLTTREVLDRIPLDRSTLWRMCHEGRFPKPIQLTRSRIGWRWSTVAAWLDERERDPLPSRGYFGRSPEGDAADAH